ncbi:uncharacterized protein LOC125763133 [Anopheles funestus]|uniref:30 kDa salivary antigen family protein n=1 Tax=Anopheles funestus TaxID=62324 RepID=Q06DI1_ANOFN|nr:uncharacterized protein LOC125763133 [Anopheles funestus]ABI83766.1 30 kDa salivary antigen family protein [Anopheles funestus]
MTDVSAKTEKTPVTTTEKEVESDEATPQVAPADATEESATTEKTAVETDGAAVDAAEVADKNGEEEPAKADKDNGVATEEEAATEGEPKESSNEDGEDAKELDGADKAAEATKRKATTDVKADGAVVEVDGAEHTTPEKKAKLDDSSDAKAAEEVST